MNIKSSENILGILIDTFAVTGRIHLQPLMLFAHSDWLIWRGLAKCYSPLSSQNITKLLSFFNKEFFSLLVIQLVWHVLTQSFTSVLVKVLSIYLATLWLGKYPPLFTSTSVNNMILSVVFHIVHKHGAVCVISALFWEELPWYFSCLYVL